MTTTRGTFGRALALAILTTTILAGAGPALADEDGCRNPRDRKGWLVGFNAGWGSSSYGATVGTRTFSDDPYGGSLGALRGGYAFSNAFAVTLEGYGFGSSAGQDDWGMGAGFATVTWWPAGGGFFVRGGLGAGGGEVLLRETGRKLEIEGKGAALFSLGYEWQLGRNFALGVAADAFGFHLDGASGLEDDYVGVGGMSIQFNWYL
ncbi:MAG: hypothetical protein IH621_14930 [Krumholzibacteria bacterium]|nr:hypothetical protein [Candidatus Krumholzibacteria bacterium]